MPTSKADRLDKLFEGESLPLAPDLDKPHIADTELVSSKPQPLQPPRTVPRVAQKPGAVTQPQARKGREIDQNTSSDEDEYIRAFKKPPTVQPKGQASHSKGSVESSSSLLQDALGSKLAVPTADDDATNGGIHQKSDRGNPLIANFCPLTLVTKFCYKYIDDRDDKISRQFFASGKIWNRTWDVHYLHPPTPTFGKPILLVPEEQVQLLVDEINTAFKIGVQLPRSPFLLAFYQDGTPNPAFLGSSHSREDVVKMEQAIPDAPADHGVCPPGASTQLEASFERFSEKLEQAVAAGKKKAASRRKGQAKDRLKTRANHVEALKRGQRYLGLRPADCKASWPLPDTSLPRHEQQRFEREQLINCGHNLPPLDVAITAPCSFDRDVVFVAVDVEAFERDHNLITEIGISTLDTADIKLFPPGHGGFNWTERIRSRHFRISDHAHLRNTTYCVGNPDRFLFGCSEFVGMNDIGKMIDSCFQPPYSRHFGRGEVLTGIGRDTAAKEQKLQQGIPPGQLSIDPVDTQGCTNVDQDLADKIAVSHLTSSDMRTDVKAGVGDPQNHGSVTVTSDQNVDPACVGSDGESGHHRNVVLVGHDLDSDLHFLSMLKSAIFSKPAVLTYPQPLDSEHPLRRRILESLDTARLHQAWKRQEQITSLAKALVGLEKTCWGLHNGGNDARYTLELLVGVLVRSRLEQGEETADPAKGADHVAFEKCQAADDAEVERATKETKIVDRDRFESRTTRKHATGDSELRAHEAVLPDPYVTAPDATVATAKRESGRHPNPQNTRSGAEVTD